MQSQLPKAVAGLLILILSCGTATVWAQGTSSGELVKLITEKDNSVIGVVQNETQKEITLIDLKTRKSLTFQKKSLKNLRRKLTDKQAVATIGLPAVVSWRIKERYPAKKAAGRIASIDFSSIYVTLTGKDGVRAGDKLLVIRGTKIIKDPKTGKVLGKERKAIARLRVTAVNEKYSKASLTGDLDVELKVGDVVEVEAPKPIAVFPFVHQSGQIVSEEHSLSEELTSWLVKDALAVVERSQFEKVRKELGRQQGMDFDAKSAQRAGKQMGAFAIVTGSIVPKGRFAQVSIRVIEVATGKVLLAVSFLTNRPEKLSLIPSTIRFNNHRYWVSDKKMTWHEARAFCNKLGGHLVCIESAKEQKFLELMTAPKGGNKRAPYWIGLTKKNGALIWVTGQKPRFFAWDYSESGKRKFESQLNAYIKKYPGITFGRGTGRWRFRDSLDFHYYFICEWDK